MKRDEIAQYLPSAFGGFTEADASSIQGASFHRGKVRDIFDLGDKLVIVTTDRISAFDRVLTTIPCKGEVLNRISLFWFRETSDIVGNHIIEEVSPRAILVEKCEVMPIEVVVRGYLTGSAWRDYEKGRPVSGITLPAGMKRDQRFETPLITPSTKEEQGLHDQPISASEIVSRGIVEKSLWERIERTAIALFRRGTEIAARNGIILVDTKYEFGIRNGELVLIDEIHTPDSSRFWYAGTYRELFTAGQDQRKIDKEYLRQWLMERGWMGDGEPPAIPDEVRIETAWRYIDAFQGITGTNFQPDSADSKAQERFLLSKVRELSPGAVQT